MDKSKFIHWNLHVQLKDLEEKKIPKMKNLWNLLPGECLRKSTGNRKRGELL